MISANTVEEAMLTCAEQKLRLEQDIAAKDQSKTSVHSKQRSCAICAFLPAADANKLFLGVSVTHFYLHCFYRD